MRSGSRRKRLPSEAWRKREQRVDDAGWRCFFNGISALKL